MSPRGPTSVHQLKVTLKRVRPPIWRRIQVASTIDLRRLHAVIQTAMGWTQSHLYEFEIGGVAYGEPSPEDFEPIRSAKSTPLRRVAPESGIVFTYVYDFGDDWEHQIVVEKVMPPEPRAANPRCIAGRRACPPEDVGGVWGYQEFLEAIRDPSHPEHASMLEWIGGDFDPNAFDLDSVNQQLANPIPSPWEL
ncbi:MAG: plasmid pRiA4b ORF-3 family protein [Chloroflexi bacterium]|nr:plasmid pRiA4b ORF-3 family protein [Chloroflexota bacterium]